MSALPKRRIEVTISLGEGQFGETAGDTITLSGYRIQASVKAQGNETQGAAQVRIYGLPLSIINQLTVIGPLMAQVRYRNRISIAAGNEGEALSTIYVGTIMDAWGDFQAAPQVALNVIAASAYGVAVKPVEATSYVGDTSVDSVMATLAQTMEMGYLNSGVDVKLSSPYFYGSALAQVRQCANAANINYNTDLGVLNIWPKGGAITAASVLLSPKTGMVGYPAFSSNGITVKSVFIAQVRQGGTATIESSITSANDTWQVMSTTHDLESETPGGSWFSTILCSRSPS